MGNLWESIGQLKKSNFRLPACCIDLKRPLKAEETALLFANNENIKVRIEHGPTTRLYLSPDPWSFFLSFSRRPPVDSISALDHDTVLL